MKSNKVKLGDMVKFSENHYSDSPGHEYVKDWIGIVIKATAIGSFLTDEIRIMWTVDGNSHIGHYDELWWNKLDYEPFEVLT